MAKSTNAGLSDHELAGGELQRDLAFFFRALWFEDRGIALNRRDAAAFSLVRAGALWGFVFVNARKFDLETPLSQRPDFEFTGFCFPSTVHLRGCDNFVASCCRGND